MRALNQCVSHSQIIANLSNYGVHDAEVDFFVNYLFDRKQGVNFQNFGKQFQNIPSCSLICQPS